MGNTFMHRNPTVFKDPLNFDPDRWLDNKELDNSLIAFSRGPRMCPGIKCVSLSSFIYDYPWLTNNQSWLV